MVGEINMFGSFYLDVTDLIAVTLDSTVYNNITITSSKEV